MTYPPALIATIETPQFRGDGTIRKFYRQTGYFYPDKLLFVAPLKHILHGHDVYFQSIEQFEKCCINSSL